MVGGYGTGRHGTASYFLVVRNGSGEIREPSREHTLDGMGLHDLLVRKGRDRQLSWNARKS